LSESILFVIIGKMFGKGGKCMANKKGENRRLVDFKCTVCEKHRVRKEKNVKNTPERMELSMYCPVCKKHTPHKESK